jgi:hypothetical protein
MELHPWKATVRYLPNAPCVDGWAVGPAELGDIAVAATICRSPVPRVRSRVGCRVTPRMRMRRVACSITAST